MLPDRTMGLDSGIPLSWELRGLLLVLEALEKVLEGDSRELVELLRRTCDWTIRTADWTLLGLPWLLLGDWPFLVNIQGYTNYNLLITSMAPKIA